MELTITQDDIDAGMQFSTKDCPISLALHRKYPAASTIRMCQRAILIDHDVYVSADAARWLFVFDHAKAAVDPGTFHLQHFGPYSQETDVGPHGAVEVPPLAA